MKIDITNIATIVMAIKNHAKNNAVSIAIAENTAIDINDLILALNKANITFMGAVFPKVVHNNTILEKGIVLNTLNNLENLFLIENISKKDYKIPPVVFNDSENYSLITYVDGLTANISHYLEKLYENYGMKTNYFGGGAGSLTLQQKPCVFNKDGFFEDAAVLSISKVTSRIGVKHGWKKVDGPFIITKSKGNIIQEINWETPFEIYKNVVEKHAKKQFTDHNFFDIAKGYPFGILKDDAECIVRDPIALNDNGELVCVGEIEENSLVDILNGNTKTLIDAAKNAALESIKQAVNPNKAILIDCISRVLFLEEEFETELKEITKTLKNAYPNIHINGALTLGEISSYGEGFLELYNKTTVVSLFES